MQALVEHKGKQFIVEENLELKLPYLGGKEGDKVNIDKVLYLDDLKNKTFGNPYITSLSITGKILSHGKVIVFKMKRRKGYQVKNGHKQKFTLVKIDKFKKAKASSSKKKTSATSSSKKTKTEKE